MINKTKTPTLGGRGYYFFFCNSSDFTRSGEARKIPQYHNLEKYCSAGYGAR